MIRIRFPVRSFAWLQHTLTGHPAAAQRHGGHRHVCFASHCAARRGCLRPIMYLLICCKRKKPFYDSHKMTRATEVVAT